jgi:uncharacterized protein YbjT (DUF2867 family)
MKTILIIGGYGQFGRRLSQRLRRLPNVNILVAALAFMNIQKAVFI